ncbi:MAG TPA: asparagine synthase (glutamine-hydrolyzing) [Longimicrobiales bacterium]|nr:asparagine synthase (glutamine-hydrolyzing) [Longimicrobiales bacterium]
MCGIAGIAAFRDGRPPTSAELASMAALLRHRGPDGDGFFVDGPVGLAHTRLSIIDLEGGAQPISNEDGSVQVVFNGEVFNYVEIRADLVKRGHRFRTRTDTEVIVHLYEELGDDFVHELNGQFAIALWDVRRRRLVLARDRVGILPLFFARAGGRLLFASEVKALLPVLGRPTLDPLALDQIMTFWTAVGDRTLFDGVKQLLPGELLTLEGDEVRRRRYWDWSFPRAGDGWREGTEDALAEELHALLRDATRMRLRADVPVGAYLSGGLDSSALVALIHELDPSLLRTFSLRFASAGLNEGDHQRAMIQHVGSAHSALDCSARAVGEAFPRTVLHAETALLRTAPAPMLLLSGMVHEYDFRVVMTGEGADEVLGGYDIFKEAKVRQFWARRPESMWRPLLLKRLYPYLELSSVRARGYVMDFFSVGLDDPGSPVFAHLPRWATTARAKSFFSDSFWAGLGQDAVEALLETIPGDAAGWHPFNRAQHVEATSLLSGYLLSSQGDRMLMANSVEGRFPFLDPRVVDFAANLDPRLKMRVLREKHLLRKAMGPHLPPAILERTKQPYRAPDAEAFFQDGQSVAPWVDELLGRETVARYGYFDPGKVTLLVRKARGGGLRSVSDNQALVGILSTQMWHHLFVDRFHSDFATDR